jgi:hypothetical protein
MAKLKPVTAEEIDAVINAAQDAQASAADIEHRLSIMAEMPESLGKASQLLSASRTFADLAHKLMTRAALDEQARMIEAKYRAEAAKGA